MEETKLRSIKPQIKAQEALCSQHLLSHVSFVWLRLSSGTANTADKKLRNVRQAADGEQVWTVDPPLSTQLLARALPMTSVSDNARPHRPLVGGGGAMAGRVVMHPRLPVSGWKDPRRCPCRQFSII